MTRPEEVLAFPFFAHDFEDGWVRDHCEAIAAACNAYPLALALAEACEAIVNADELQQPTKRDLACKAMRDTLDAFLAHRQEPNNA